MVGQFANIWGSMVPTVLKFAQNVSKDQYYNSCKVCPRSKASYVISKLSIQRRLIFLKKLFYLKISYESNL